MALDIKATLRERGLKQKDVAVRLEVSEPTLSQWSKALREGAYRRVPAEKAKALADLLGIELAQVRPDLFGKAA